jgi:hypothetical protein
LVVDVSHHAKESCISAFCSSVAATLQENSSLESLAVQTSNNRNSIKIKADEYFVLVTALQNNTTLKTLRLCGKRSLRLNDDESKQMAALLKQNYVLGSLPDIDLDNYAEIRRLLDTRSTCSRYWSGGRCGRLFATE